MYYLLWLSLRVRLERRVPEVRALASIGGGGDRRRSGPVPLSERVRR
jgi:hypothetical protein